MTTMTTTDDNHDNNDNDDDDNDDDDDDVDDNVDNDRCGARQCSMWDKNSSFVTFDEFFDEFFLSGFGFVTQLLVDATDFSN